MKSLLVFNYRLESRGNVKTSLWAVKKMWWAVVKHSIIHHTAVRSISKLFGVLMHPVSLSSQAWSCWPSGCGGRWAWRPISRCRLRRAPMHHMSSSGPEPPSLFSVCSAASPHAAAAHGCSNWSVMVQRALWNIPCLVWSCVSVSSLCFLQYAMFLILVFLAELVAGVSGFIFRHEVRQSSKASRHWKKRKKWNRTSFVLQSPDQCQAGGRL